MFQNIPDYVLGSVPHWCLHQYIVTSLKRLFQVAGAVGVIGPHIRHTRKCVNHGLRMHALLYQVVCDRLVLALVYCNFNKLGKVALLWPEGPEAPTLGQCISACTTIPLGCVRICHFQLRQQLYRQQCRSVCLSLTLS